MSATPRTVDWTEVITHARTEAGLTQTALAKKMGVHAPSISSFESGKREPSIRMLYAVIEATGHKLVMSVEPLDE